MIILSDLFDDVATLHSGLKHFRHRRHDVSVMQIIDPAEQDFPFDDPTRFRGLEGQAEQSAEPRCASRRLPGGIRAFPERGAGHFERPGDGLHPVANGPPARWALRSFLTRASSAGDADLRRLSPSLPLPLAAELLAFGFTNPWLLAGLAARAIPILIHLFHRRTYRETDWAAMRFLIEASRKNSRRMRLEQLVLLAVRTLLLLLAALAFADPIVQAVTRRTRPTNRSSG